MTLRQLLDQASRIDPDWCACGVRHVDEDLSYPVEIIFDYNDVRKANEDVSCKIHSDPHWRRYDNWLDGQWSEADNNKPYTVDEAVAVLIRSRPENKIIKESK